MSALHASVLTSFKNAGWTFQEVKGMEVVEANFEAYHGNVPLHVQSFAEAHILAVVANCTITVPNTHRTRAAELIMRTNKELNLGNFEMDWDSGQVMFRLSNVFPNHRYDEKIITSLVHNAVAEMDRFMPFLGELCQVPKSDLALYSIRALLARTVLLPPLQEENGTTGS